MEDAVDRLRSRTELKDITSIHCRLVGNNMSLAMRAIGDGTKPGLWTLDWTMDWTVDWIMD